jgi:hypothetical protein
VKDEMYSLVQPHAELFNAKLKVNQVSAERYNGNVLPLRMVLGFTLGDKHEIRNLVRVPAGADE